MNRLAKALELATNWHSGVVYGGGMKMLEQVLGTYAHLLENYKGADVQDVLMTALLSKAWEHKRRTLSVNIESISPELRTDAHMAVVEDVSNQKYSKAERDALMEKICDTNAEATTNPDNLEKVFGKHIVDNVRAMATEPDLKDWHAMASWASQQNSQVKAVLLAEKLQNFVVSRDKPNPKKEPAWHINYYNTRMIMVEAVKEASPELYAKCVEVAEQGITAQKAKLAEMEQVAQPSVVVKADNTHVQDRTNSR